ncbi:MAG: hypothetical protein ACRD8O_13860 [Bryobacteraceae bacterium]
MTGPGEPTATIQAPEDLAGLDEALASLPNSPAVFLLWPREGAPYLAKTALLRRRLLRLLAERAKTSRLLNLRHTVARVDCWLTGSPLESMLAMYGLARRHFASNYLDVLRLRLPPYVKIVLDNRFPRSTVTRRIARAPALYFGPFRSRASAERFEGEFLNLFQIRRCEEELAPAPDHPGCIYGEMGMCLRPCQLVVGEDEYSSEVGRASAFLSTRGRSLTESVGQARERLSEEMNFEEAAKQHKRLERIEEVLKLCDELASDIDRLSGVAVTRSPEPGAVELRFVYKGWWQAAARFAVAPAAEGKSVSMDQRLRELAAEREMVTDSTRARQEHLAILARWFYSSWREGEWLAFERLEDMSYRKLVRAISRVAASQ